MPVSFSLPGGAWCIMVGLPECVCLSHPVHASGHPFPGHLASLGMSPALNARDSFPFPSSFTLAIFPCSIATDQGHNHALCNSIQL